MTNLFRKSLVTVLITLCCVVGIQTARRVKIRAARPGVVASASFRVKGDPRAGIQVIEYIDLRCGPCAYGSGRLGDLIARYPGKIFLEVRYFPLDLPTGIGEFRFVECAGRQGKFWPAFDGLMSRQKEWKPLADPQAYFFQIAGHLGLEMERLEACFNDPAVYDELVAARESARQMGLNATPTYFINGRMVVGAGEMETEIRKLLGLPPEKGAGHEDH